MRKGFAKDSYQKRVVGASLWSLAFFFLNVAKRQKRAMYRPLLFEDFYANYGYLRLSKRG